MGLGNKARKMKMKTREVTSHAKQHVKKVVNRKKFESRFQQWETNTLKELLVYHDIEGTLLGLVDCGVRADQTKPK